jgi:hypothetical protein
VNEELPKALPIWGQALSSTDAMRHSGSALDVSRSRHDPPARIIRSCFMVMAQPTKRDNRDRLDLIGILGRFWRDAKAALSHSRRPEFLKLSMVSRVSRS